jgi:hypothetical protein
MLQSNSASCALSEIHKAEDLPGAGANESQSRRLGYSQPIDVKRFTEANHCSVSYLLEQSLCSAPIVLFPVSTGGAFYTKFKKELTLRLFVLI